MTHPRGEQFTERIQPMRGRAKLSKFPSFEAVLIPGMIQAPELNRPNVFVVDYEAAIIYVSPSLDGLLLNVTYTIEKSLVDIPSVKSVLHTINRKFNMIAEKYMVRGMDTVNFVATGAVQAISLTPNKNPKAIASAYLVDVASGLVQSTVFQLIDQSDAAGPFPAGACWLEPGRISASIPAGLAVATYRLAVIYFY